jgi:lysyl-tRNA synthetase class 2
MPTRAAGELATCSIRDWEARAAAPGPEPHPAVLCGRVVYVAAGERFLLDDGSAALWCRLPPGAPDLVAGDFAAVTVAEAAGERAAAAVVTPQQVQRLARPKGRGGEFPAPTGDWFRLQRDSRQRARNLERRSHLLGCIRSFFSRREFVEIEAPLVVPSPGLELHLAAMAVAPGERYLITSPEYQLKRLLTGGLRRIYSLGKVFRHGELGPHHNPEFTMLEWYRAYAPWSAVADDVAELCAELATAVHGRPQLRYRGQELDLTPPWPTLTVAEAMQRHSGLRIRGDESTAELRDKVRAGGFPDPPPVAGRAGGADAWSWDDVFFSVFLDHVEPALARAAPGQPVRPVVLIDWPAPLCALARPKPGAPEVVERFEAYLAGLELCNGFGELCDEVEQRRRLEHDAAERARRGLPVYPQDERFLWALAEGMPPAGGVALGVDRLLMLLLDAAHIRDVLAFTADEL